MAFKLILALIMNARWFYEMGKLVVDAFDAHGDKAVAKEAISCAINDVACQAKASENVALKDQ